MLEIRDLRFGYPGGFGLEVSELAIARGEKVAFVGPSGSGKTTLIYLATGIVRPDSGAVSMDGVALAGKTDVELRNLRISRVGFIFQEFELLEYLGTVENILLPYLVNRSLVLDAEVRERARELATTVGLGAMLERRPAELSHGERQRVAICRALVTRPAVIVADEPTGNLDRANADAIMKLIVEQVAERGTTLIAVTHDRSLLELFDRVVDLGEFASAGSGSSKDTKR
ncbi:MAG: ABC transporter ATP-binding protein [Planctomycetota bacterium]